MNALYMVNTNVSHMLISLANSKDRSHAISGLFKGMMIYLYFLIRSSIRLVLVSFVS